MEGASREAMVKGFHSMNFANSNVLERPTEAVRENIARAEEYLQPKVRQGRKLVDRMKASVRDFPMAAVWTAFAGGLIVGAALLSRRQSIRDVIVRDLSEPLQRGGRILSETIEAAEHALRDGSDSVRTMAKRDIDLLRKQAGRLQNRFHL